MKKTVELPYMLDLLTKLVSIPADDVLGYDVKGLHHIIEHEIPDFFKKNAPPNFAEIYFDFQYYYKQFCDILMFSSLEKKKIVAVGGGFSTGKSSFLNTLLGRKILPSAINPSTSVPTYVVQGKEERVIAVNEFGNKILLQMDDIPLIAHGFNADDGTDEISFGHLLNSIFIEVGEQSYENIAFLDTPGYSAFSSAANKRTDKTVAQAELKASDIMLWFVAADAGMISEDDIDFLRSMPSEIAKVIVLSKVDKVANQEALDELKQEVAKQLDANGILYEEIFTFTRKNDRPSDLERIKEYLNRNNQLRDEENLAYKFKQLFVLCGEYYDRIIEDEQRKLAQVNRILTETENDELSQIAEEHKKNITSLTEQRTKMKELQTKFFTMLKTLSDSAGIPMPEPTAVEVLGDRRINPLNSIRHYNEGNKEAVFQKASQMLNMLTGVKVKGV